MSDESDGTRRFSPGDDATRPRGTDDADATRIDDAAGADTPAGAGTPARAEASAGSDATRVDAAADDARPRGVAAVPAPDDEDTFPGGGSRDDDTLDGVRGVPTIRDEPTAVPPRPDATAVMPPATDDWAPSRANPAWSGRAEVRPPQPGRGYPEVDWAAAAPAERRDRWWMPIVVGLIALLLLGVLGWAIYLIVQNTDDPPAPAQSATTSAAPVETATTPESTPPSTQPTTTSAAPMPSTTEPTISEVMVPALRGLALADAQAALNSTGLNYRLIFRSGDAPAGTVLDSDPAEGQEVPPDTVVTLVVAAEGQTTGATATTDGPGAGGN